jgi:RHS repeat-associated protein
LAYANGSATTLSVSPQAVGDLMVFVVNVDGGPVSSVSGGGVTTWNKDIAKVGTEEGNDNEIWWGVVSASGASTITVAFTGSHSGDELMAQEYSAGAGATWSTGATGSTSSSTSTITFPSLTPAGAGELYLGFAQVDGGGEAGSTPGFSYTITSAEASVLCWDTNVSTTTSPTATQTGSGSDSVGALFAASGGTGGTTTTTAATTTTTGATTTTVPTGTTTTTVPSSTTTTSVSGSGATTPLLWAGQYQDPTTGLYYMRARWYDPATGEFLSVDPDFNSTLDAYGYADENPLDNVDPSGLMVVMDDGGYVAAKPPKPKTPAAPKKTTTSYVVVDPAGTKVSTKVYDEIETLAKTKDPGPTLGNLLVKYDPEYDQDMYNIDHPCDPNTRGCNWGEDPSFSMTLEPGGVHDQVPPDQCSLQQAESSDNPCEIHFGLSQGNTEVRDLIACGANPMHATSCPDGGAPTMDGQPVDPTSTNPFIQAWIMRTYIDDRYGSTEQAWQAKEDHHSWY